MIILVFVIVFALLFLLCIAWIYINSCVFELRKFVNDEIVIEDVPMKQFFHFMIGEIDDEGKI